MGTAARVTWELQSGQSSGQPDPGDRSRHWNSRPVFHTQSHAYDAGFVSDTSTTKDSGLGVQDVRARFPASYHANLAQGLTRPAEGGTRLWDVYACPEAIPDPGFSLRPRETVLLQTVVNRGGGAHVTQAGVASAGEDVQDRWQMWPPQDPAPGTSRSVALWFSQFCCLCVRASRSRCARRTWQCGLGDPGPNDTALCPLTGGFTGSAAADTCWS